jgi:hypothetical protein
MATTSKQSELVTLRGKWFKERTRLYDRETGLPTVAVLMDDLRVQLEERGSLAVLVFRPSSEGHVEEVSGLEAYDDLLLDFVRRLKAFQTDGIVPMGTFCLPYVRSTRSSSSSARTAPARACPTRWGRRRPSSTS